MYRTEKNMHGLEDKMEKKTWKESGMIQMFKSHMGILAGLLIGKCYDHIVCNGDKFF